MNWGVIFTKKKNREHPLWKTPEIAGLGIPGKFSSLKSNRLIGKVSTFDRSEIPL
jgi:hypothetical protein